MATGSESGPGPGSSSSPEINAWRSQAKNMEGDECDSNDDDSVEFYDACSDEQQLDQTRMKMDLDTSLEEAQIAINYFFNNKFEEARTLLKPFADTSLYHSMGYAVFSFLEAVLTFEHIEEASDELKKCLDLCQRFKKKTTITESIGQTFKKKNFSQMTDLECHAELCMAEGLLLNALLTFIEDENLSSLIRGSLKVRQCYNLYRSCEQIMKQRKWESLTLKSHFDSGVRMGIGTFNLMISMLPARIVKILEFIGFTANKHSGLNDLYIGYQEAGLRQVLCALTLLGYHLMVVAMLSHQHGDLTLCQDILSAMLEKYPNGVWILFFKGRLEFIKGNLVDGETWYIKSWRSQDVWPQFHHLTFWDLLWLNCLQKKWKEADVYATNLLQKSNWSRSIYAYQLAVIKLMHKNPSQSDIGEIEGLMRDVPTCRQRIAGKSLPMEKFMAKRAARYTAQNGKLILPVIELMYLWNVFKVFSKNYNIADGILQMIEKELSFVTARTEASLQSYYADNRALCLLLRGACFRQMEKPALALQDLEECIGLQNSIKEDTFIIPYAYCEAALVHAFENREAQAIAMLQDTRKKFSHFSLESRLHFRIHAALMELKSDVTVK
ncbi:tetratricopeptide repeat protein 39B-like [Scaptodrosophila lebanonensis]|uniref:Tetratricopeptide repeat protein 39B-like n=1 Tax=Drosophila lebanonensis TaxID=7225 RepID=A0A6J2TY49_DROLE|nr:tetratricopeptide repeat protein 39B-like [Scaptodrosophila lebanonensis]XP_030379811.1 tetratricopeptide repeat protein 39B-like [Scaptodrosophila lebanonensis]XP_030379812.1 tetratricopeptide repeat protein 39B-like [Scaptodrosophila lebanonensis]